MGKLSNEDKMHIQTLCSKTLHESDKSKLSSQKLELTHVPETHELFAKSFTQFEWFVVNVQEFQVQD